MQCSRALSQKLTFHVFSFQVSATKHGVSNRQVKNLLAQHQHQKLRPVRSAESLVQIQPDDKPKQPKVTQDPQPASNPVTQESGSRPISLDLDELAPLEVVQKAVGQKVGTVGSSRNSPKTHSRSSSHDSYFEPTRKLSVQFSEDEELLSPNAETERLDSNLDLSEIQMNFDLEESEMRIFSEDEDAGSNPVTGSMASDLNTKSPSEVKVAKLGELPEDPASSFPPRKMSFREKFKRFTSPTQNRKTESPVAQSNENEPKTLREKIVGALSPENRRKNSASSKEGSPAAKKKANSASPVAKRSKVKGPGEEDGPPKAVPEDDSPGKAHGLPLSPSINFIDASMSESMEQSTNSQVMPEEEVNSFIGNSKFFFFPST